MQLCSASAFKDKPGAWTVSRSVVPAVLIMRSRPFGLESAPRYGACRSGDCVVHLHASMRLDGALVVDLADGGQQSCGGGANVQGARRCGTTKVLPYQLEFKSGGEYWRRQAPSNAAAQASQRVAGERQACA